MNPTKVVSKKIGRLEIFENLDKGYFLVRASGVINPRLVQEDLCEAEKFAKKYQKPWVYIVDTAGVKLANPLNLILLRKIRKLPYLSKYVIYAPSKVVRGLGKITDFIIKPNIVFKTKEELKQYLNSL